MPKEIDICQLQTPFEKGTADAWNEYPRPQLRRSSYISLCGKWELFVKQKGNSEIKPLGEIVVPFPPESRLSGVQRELKPDERYIYKKKFSLPDSFNKGRVKLNFGAVDQLASVYVNGALVTRHEGGYLPFSCDITDFLKEGQNCLCVRVTDELDSEFAYGKQRKKRGGMWYTPISGIWQAVWLESVPTEHIERIRLDTTTDSVTLKVYGVSEDLEKSLTIKTQDGDIALRFVGNEVTVPISSPRLWTPESPYLYEFTLSAGDDTIESYFALRTIGIKEIRGKSFITLNGKPYFFNGLLDQGYYSDGIYTPASPEGYVFDIVKMKELGFNMLRKHIKTEPELFYYYCDKLGMIVFQDMVNSGKYSFLIDTALPTVFLKKGISHKASERRRRNFESDCERLTELLYNHPSVVYYTIFNEGWGQYDSDRLYEKFKTLDPSRIWDSTSGWFKGRLSDVTSEHVYFKPIKLKAEKGRPLVLSEFGGYSCRIEGHCFNLSKSYGYKTFSDTESLTEGLKRLYIDEVIPEIKEKGLCGLVLTQLSDVEDEINGICTYDRQVVKPDTLQMRCISESLKTAFENITKE